MTIAPAIATSALRADDAERDGARHALGSLYAGELALWLIAVCGASCDGRAHGRSHCEHAGKTPLDAKWNAAAAARAARGLAERGAWIDSLAQHVARGGNVGLAVPDDLIVLDADSAAARAWLEGALPDAPMQETAKGAHFVARAAPGADVKARLGVELAPGVLVDLRVGRKSQIVVEPSVHATGALYTWRRELPARASEIPELPSHLLARIADAAKPPRAPTGAPRSAGHVAEGGRNDFLFREASALRRRGHDEGAILAALAALNERECIPPLPEHELRVIARSAARYAPEPAPGAPQAAGVQRSQPGSEPLTDTGNAERLVRLHGADLRYAPELGRWLCWDGQRFAVDVFEEIQQRAKATVRGLYAEAAALPDEGARKALAKHASRSESAARREAMISLARSEPGIPVATAALDADPWLLACANGTLDLRTGRLREARRDDLLTKLAPVRFDDAATAPTWHAFLERILPDAQVRAFVQRAVGYSLTGSTGEQVLFLAWGAGANGKSTFVQTLLELLGDYAMRTPAETLLARRENAIPNDVAALRGARFVAAVETEEGRRLAEVRVKELTGGDTVSARFMRAEFFTFKPVAKLWIATNHRPAVRGTDEAIWRRIRLIPFAVTIPESERDPRLPDRLRAERPGILTWAVEGCLAWQREGLRAPSAVVAATSSYRAEQDVLGSFLDERCVAEPTAWIATGELYRAFKAWVEGAGEHAMTQRAFANALAERGFDSVRQPGGERTRGWIGLRLIAANGGHSA